MACELHLSNPTYVIAGSYFRLQPGMWWVCSCGQWRKKRSDQTGEPFEEGAKRLHRKHVKELETRLSKEI